MLQTLNILKYKKKINSFFIFKPNFIEESVDSFLKFFSGTTIYSVKTNPLKCVLKTIHQNGINHFEASSMNEIKKIAKLFRNPKIFYMNPIKSRHSISKAYFKFGVKHFSVDHEDELKKILEETKNAGDLCLHLRIKISNKFAKYKIENKFGIGKNKAVELLKKISYTSCKIGMSFHPGSQCMDIKGFILGIRFVKKILKKSNMDIDYLNVGGGFPSTYENLRPKNLKSYFTKISKEFSKIENHKNIKLLSEPGRALVSGCLSLIVRVELRKKKKLYINDGIYGSLRGIYNDNFLYSVKIVDPEKKNKTKLGFSFYGPTCDSNDYLKGPFLLPYNVKEGDLIEICQVGAYSTSMHSKFNGFSKSKIYLME